MPFPEFIRAAYVQHMSYFPAFEVGSKPGYIKCRDFINWFAGYTPGFKTAFQVALYIGETGFPEQFYSLLYLPFRHNKQELSRWIRQHVFCPIRKIAFQSNKYRTRNKASTKQTFLPTV
mgnify:CR=1 FL=1